MLQIHADKPFAYYILTEKCLTTYQLESFAFGNSSRCDVFVNSFKEICDDRNIPKHITYWSSGRNLLYYQVKQKIREYFYHIFMDDDAIPIYTEHVIKFRNATLSGDEFADVLGPYMKSANGLKDAIYMVKDGKSV